MKTGKARISSYHGVKLIKNECNILQELEDITGLSIPSGKCGFYNKG